MIQALTPPRLHDLGRARTALETFWPFLHAEPDLTDEDQAHADKLADLMARETFFRELPAIDEHTRALEQAYIQRHAAAAQARAAAYTEALATLRATPGWEQLNAEQQQRVTAPLATRATTDGADGLPIPLLRTDVHACTSLVNTAVEEMLRIVDGNRVVRVNAASYFVGGIETEEQLNAALVGLRDQCIELIGAGKKVLVQ